MFDLILGLIPGGSLTVIGAGVLAILGFLFGYGRHREGVGRSKERAKQAKQRERARDIADEVDNDIGTLSPEQRREGLKTWSED